MKTKATDLTTLAAHLERVSANSRGHGGHGWTYDEEIEMLRTAAQELDDIELALARAAGRISADVCADRCVVGDPRVGKLAKLFLDIMRDELFSSAAPSNTHAETGPRQDAAPKRPIA